MNRDGFFTIRGVKDGVHEIDLLGVRQTTSRVEAWHIESQVSFNPVSYITPLTKELSQSLKKARTTAWKRPPEVVAQCVDAWLEKKFDSPSKARVREKLWPGLNWQKILVHGAVKNADELDLIGKRVRLIPFYEVLRDLCWQKHNMYVAGGNDIAEIIEYYHDSAPAIEVVK